MNLRQLAVMLLFGITVSVANGIGLPGTASLGPTDDATSNQAPLVFGSNNAANTIPGGNIIDGTVSPGNLPNVTAAAVPEPSTIGLLSLSVVGYGLLRIRRR